MRPRSITGPLILIAIGVLFLLHNVRPDLSLFSLLAMYWPFLLIGAGVIGLIEVLFHASRGTAVPPRPFSGAAIFWVVVLCLIAAFVNRHRTVNFRGIDGGEITIFGSDYDYDVSASDVAPASAQGVAGIVLDNLRGDLSIKGVDSDTVDVKGRKTVRAFNRVQADRRNQQTRIRLDREGDLLIVRSSGPLNSVAGQITTDLDISVPRGMNIESRGRNGELTIEGIDGMVDLSAGRGDVRLDRIGKNVRIESSRGGEVHAKNLKGDLDMTGRGSDVQLTGVAGQVTIHGEFAGMLDFRAEGVPGEMTLDLGDLRMSNVAGPVHFQTSTRDVQATDVSNALDLMVNRGDIHVTVSSAPLPKIDAHTRNGDVTFTVPGDAAFQLNGSTSQGDIANDFGSALRISSDGRRTNIIGRTGNGPQINLTTDRGTLSVAKD